MIEVSHLTKYYGSHPAVRDLSFTVEKGHIYGFLGPNGAGKSTTMNILTGCLAATDGSVRIGGYDIFEQETQAKRLIGYLPEQPPLYPDMTPREYLTFVARAKGVQKTKCPDETDYACAVTGLEPVQDRLIRVLSKGYRQRVGIAGALLGQPEVIILDEPTVGLDPKQIIEIRKLITTLGQDHTVLLSSHILSQVRAVCDDILILSKGRLVAADTPENLERRFAGACTVSLLAKCTPQQANQALAAVPVLKNVQLSPQDACVQITAEYLPGKDCTQESVCEQLFFAFASIHRPILALSGGKASLEDVFLALTEKEDDEKKEEEKP